ncbi:MAG: glycosyltransferase family 39 protein [Verrucomicrobia bacterium]|nr:glycosyltransferase family 39 protein [Verrucomicrobiota bacterium]
MDWKKIEKRLIPLLVLAGVALRFIQLPFSCIWLDEAFSIKLAHESLLRIVQMLSSDNGSPLFYFLLHGWMGLFGDGEYALTTLTVLLDCAALIAVPFFLCELFADSRVRIAGTACAAFCLPCLHQATNLRYYSLMVFCTVMGWLFFYRALRRGALRDGMLFVFFSVAGFYTHTLYLFVPLSQFVVLAVFHRERLRAGFMASMFLLAGMILWMPSLALQVSGYISGSTPETVPELMHYHGAIGAYLLSISSQMLAIDGMKLVRMAAAAALILFVLFQMVRGRSDDDRSVRELFVAHLFSIGVIVTLSTFRPVFWLDKIDLIGLPLVCALIGYAASKVRRTTLFFALLIAINFAGAVRYTEWRVTGKLTEQRDVIARLGAEISSNDAVLETGISHFTVDYYLDQMKIQTGPRYVFPEIQMTRPSCIDPKKLLEDQRELTQEAAILVQKLKSVGGRIYVFHSPYEGLAPLYRQIDSSFMLERSIPVRQHPWGPVYTQVDVYRRR